MVQLDTAADPKAAFGVTRESISVSFFLPLLSPAFSQSLARGRAPTPTDTPDNFLASSSTARAVRARDTMRRAATALQSRTMAATPSAPRPLPQLKSANSEEGGGSDWHQLVGKKERGLFVLRRRRGTDLGDEEEPPKSKG